MSPMHSTWVRAAASLLFAFSATQATHARPQDLEPSALPEAGRSYTLKTLIRQALGSSPDLLRVQAEAEAAQARLRSARRPANNPELSAEYERSDATAFSLGLSQTLDWHDKRSTRSKVAESEWAATQTALEAKTLDLAYALATKTGDLATVHKTLSLARERVGLMTRILELAQQRVAAGDAAEPERDLAQLALSEASLQYGAQQSELLRHQREFAELAGRELDYQAQFPKRLASLIDTPPDVLALAREHPTLRLAHAVATTARQRVNLADQDRRPDPTVGVSVGRDAGEGRVAISLSLPWNVFNDFSDDVAAANSEALAAEQQVQLEERAMAAKITAARARFNLTAKLWVQWTKETRGSLDGYLSTLEVQWNAGEISTSDYLLQVGQALDARIAEAELHGNLWTAWIEWLYVSAGLMDWLDNDAKE